jgi:hypothetical protein
MDGMKFAGIFSIALHHRHILMYIIANKIGGLTNSYTLPSPVVGRNKQVAWIKRSEIRGFVPLIVPYSATLHTGYAIFKLIEMVKHGVISEEPGYWWDVFLYGDIAGSFFRCSGAIYRVELKRAFLNIKVVNFVF